MSDLQTLESLQAQREALNVRREIQTLERQLRAETLTDSVVWESSSWGETVDPYENRNDVDGWGPFNSSAVWRDDRKDGRYRPFYQNEQDLLSIWGLARWLSGSDEIGQSPLEALTNYTMGNGFVYQVNPKKTARPAPAIPGAAKPVDPAQGLADECQAVIDEFIERSQWEGQKERELFQRAVVDGEFGAWVRACGGGKASLRITDPECITQPTDPRQLEDYYGLPCYSWSFGVATDHGDTSMPHGYFLMWHGDSNDWDYAPSSEFVHAKFNVPTSAKRGLSDYYPVTGTIRKVGRLLDNMLHGMGDQAAIAFIVQHAQGVTPGQAQSMVANAATSRGTKAIPGGSRLRYNRRYDPGTRLDISAGLEYLPPPIAQSGVADAVVGIVQAGLRRLGSRWQLPEFITSSDASNGNYASILVAGSPFVVATENRQASIRRPFSRIFWRVLEIACASGRFAAHQVYRIEELRKAVELVITPPAVAVGESKRDTAETDKILVDMGAKSIQTVAEESGLDYQAEQERGAKAAVVSPAFDAAPSPLPGARPTMPTPGLASGAGGAPLGDTLNGAQITAAIDTIKSSGEEISDIAAIILLRRVGLSDQEARQVVSAQKQATIQAKAEAEKQRQAMGGQPFGANPAAPPKPGEEDKPKQPNPFKESWQKGWWE